MARLFVAVWPSTEVLALLRGLDRVDGRLRWVREEHRHVTLRFLGDADRDEVAARLTGTTLPSAVATLGPTVERLGAGAVVVPVAGLDELAAAVRDATTEIGRPESRPFHGHLTIARLTGRTRPVVIGAPIDGSFDVRDVTLVESRLSSVGPAYTTVATFPTT